MGLLALIADLAADGDAVGTQTLARAVFDAQRFRGEPALLSSSDAYGGFRAELETLEREGLVDIDPGIAEYHAPDRPAPISHELYVSVTDAGRDALDPRNSA